MTISELTLKDGTVLEIQELKDINGNPKYLINDPSGLYTPFSWSPHMPADPTTNLESNQKIALAEIMEKLKV